METMNNIPIISFAGSKAWESWLKGNYTLQSGVWIKMAKKNSGVPSVTHLEALDVALCYGWIDGQARGLDETYHLRKFTPRRPRSLWSKINIGKVETLIQAGLMQPSGYAAIEAAKADGRWDAAYEPQSAATIPADFAAELAKHKQAEAYFTSLNKAAQYAFFWRLMTAKTPAIRANRLEKMLTMLREGKQFHG
jgi:uncharacterized protein YdeI (YjbR/CyaY-like superfamily)